MIIHIIWIIVWLDQNVMKMNLLWEKEKAEVAKDIPAEITELANQRLKAKQEKNYALADEIVDYWTNFAKYGNPNGAQGNEPWHPATKADPFVMHLDVK